MARPTRRPRSIRGQQGQAIVMFAFMLSGMLLMSTLLFDAANALVMRLRLQNSADGAALAAANMIPTGNPTGCNGGNGSTPRAVVQNAAVTAATQNLNGMAVDSVTVTCPPSHGDVAVKVVINATAPVFFGGVLGNSSMAVSANGTAINGGVSGGSRRHRGGPPVESQ